MSTRPSGQNFSQLKITGLKTDGTPRNQISLQTEIAECNMAARSSPKFSANQKEGRVNAEYWLNTDDTNYAANSIQAISDFLGYSTAVLGGSNTATGINRFIPYPHPTSPNYLYAETVPNIEGDVPSGKDSVDVGTFDEAKCTVNFGTRDYIIGDNGYTDESKLQQYVSIWIEPTGRYERVPTAGYLVWENPPYAANHNYMTVANAAAVILCEAEIFCTWWQIPVNAIPWDAINACVGHCDGGILRGDGSGKKSYYFLKTSYLGPIFNPGPGSSYTFARFICLTPKISKPYPMPGANGMFAVDITYHFKYYPNGANCFYRWETGQFEEAGINGVPATNDPLLTWQPFFQEADFGALWYGTILSGVVGT